MSTTMSRPFQPNAVWLKQAEGRLKHVAKEINGEPNPSYTRLQQEIADWKRNDQEWQSFVEFVESQYGFSKINRYPINKRGEYHGANTAFYGFGANGNQSNVMHWVSIEEAWQAYLSR